MPDGPIDQRDPRDDWHALAAKLTDAGLSDYEATEWVRQVVAYAWHQGWVAGTGDGWSVATDAGNPYEA